MLSVGSPTEFVEPLPLGPSQRATNTLPRRVVISVVASIDLNDVDALARTCRGIRAGLVQNRKILLASALRCTNEEILADPDETFRFRARAGNWYYMEDGRSYNGKTGKCARDMVAECRRCARVVCRVSAVAAVRFLTQGGSLLMQFGDRIVRSSRQLPLHSRSGIDGFARLAPKLR